MRLVSKCLLTALAAGMIAGAASADTATEKKIVKQVFSSGGRQGSSATFTQVGTFGETFVGVRQSATIEVSQGFWNAAGTPSCCVGLVGNIDCDPSDAVDVADLTVLIDYLFIRFTPLCCEDEAYFGPSFSQGQTTTGTNPDVASLTGLIDYLFFTFGPLPSCP